MKPLGIIIIFLCAFLVRADVEERPMLWGSLDWSSDGRYIAVTTDKGVHIHNSDDLSLFKVLHDSLSTAIKWSNDGLRLAFASKDGMGVTVWDLRSEEGIHLTLPGVQDPVQITSIQWSPDSEAVAVAFEDEVQIHVLERSTVHSRRSFEAFRRLGWPQIDWRPGGTEILSGPFINGMAITHRYTGMLIDYIWNMEPGNSPFRWSPDGNMIAAGGDPVSVWRVKPGNPYNEWGEIGGELVNRLDYEPGRLQGLSWHLNSSKLAFVFTHAESGYPPKRDFSRDGALIWDKSTHRTILIPGVFVFDLFYHTHKVIEWSPDGSKLAALSSDGRIVTWEGDTYHLIAEYDGFRSILDR